MKKVVFIVIVIALAAAAGAGGWYLLEQSRQPRSSKLTLHGNIDIRDAQLAFPIDERVRQVLVEEGDVVQPGQLLATLDTRQLAATFAGRQAEIAVQRDIIRRLQNGSRPEEVQQAKAAVEVASVKLANAKRTLDRLKGTDVEGAVSKQQLDDAQAAFSQASAELDQQRATLKLSELGPREEEKAEAESKLIQLQAQLAAARERLNDAELRAPAAGVIRARIIEPGESAGPQKPAFTLSLTDPKWARVYVSETDLGRVKPGQRARIFTDSYPGRPYEAWVGFISPEAEFTPKSVETTELRTALVYELRVYVHDTAGELRLGMPVTVELDDRPPVATQPAATAPAGRGM